MGKWRQAKLEYQYDLDSKWQLLQRSFVYMYVYLILFPDCFLWTDPQSEIYIGIPEFGWLSSGSGERSGNFVPGFFLRNGLLLLIWRRTVSLLWITIRDCFAGYMVKTIAETGRHCGRARLWFIWDGDHGSLLFCSFVV